MQKPVSTNLRAGFYAASDGCRIAYRDYGAPDAAPVFFCSMGTAAMSVWSPVTDRLALTHRVILHDRRGNGDSDAGAPDSHAFSTFRDDALGVLDTVGVQQADICGMAFGARVALRMACDAPRRARSLCLFDATGAPPAPEAERQAGSNEAARLRAAAGLPTPARDPAWFARRDTSAPNHNGRALAGHPAWIEGLSSIRTRTLIACGEQDPNLAGSRRLAQEIPEARFRQMPMTGHASILDRPDLVLSILTEFLAGD